MDKIKHPLPKGTKVKYLSPRCPCSGSRWALAEGKITAVAKGIQPNVWIYGILGEKQQIPDTGILEVLSNG